MISVEYPQISLCQMTFSHRQNCGEKIHNQVTSKCYLQRAVALLREGASFCLNSSRLQKEVIYPHGINTMCDNFHPCAVCHPISFVALHDTHNPMLGVRIGEADNPGPEKKEAVVRFAVCNPHAIRSHKAEILSLNSDIVFVAETSATKASQSEFQNNIRGNGYRCFWSPPVDSKYQTDQNEFSLRGEPLGAAVLTSMPSRDARIQIPQDLWMTNRISLGIINIGGVDTLCIAIYGYAKKCFDGRRLNDLLLARVFNIISDTRMPYIIGGDFNEQPLNLPSFQAFVDQGACEAHKFYHDKFQQQLPPTCRGATYNDTLIFHPFFRDRIEDMIVNHDLQMDSHSPLIVTLNFQKEVPETLTWQIPDAWADLDIDKAVLEMCYNKKTIKNKMVDFIDDEQSDPESTLQFWSQTVEQAVDMTLQMQHKNDPLRFPLAGLPKKCFGRCQPRQLLQRPHVNPPKKDAFHGYDPPDEVFREKTKKKVKQVRRIKSLLRAISSANHYQQLSDTGWDPVIYNQISHEWKVILEAKGYGKSWKHWVLQFECIPAISLQIPSYDELHLMAQLTEHDCNMACNFESSNRQKNHKRMFQIDIKEGSGKMVYRKVKHNPIKTLSGIPIQTKCEGMLCRLTKGPACIRLTHDTLFQTETEATFGNSTIKILRQDGRRLLVQIVDGILPQQASVIQKSFAYSPSQIHSEFKNFWEPIWLREHDNDQYDINQWQSFQEEIADISFPNYDLSVNLDCPEIWESTIKRMKKGSAHGVCGWRVEELCLLPKVAIKHLSKIFSRLWHTGLPESLMKARTVLLSKRTEPRGMQDSRPITILSVLCRLASKIIADQLLSQLAVKLPPQISGGLPRRGVKDLSLLQHFQIEKALCDGRELGGFTLDLVKAFNKIPRAPLKLLFKKFGIPEIVSQYWFSSLANLTRYPQALGSLVDPSVRHVASRKGTLVPC